MKWELPLLRWQQDALTAYEDKDLKNFVLYATPGAGKTIWSLRVGHQLMHDEIVGGIVVVVHTDNLRLQWSAKAAEVGLKLLSWDGDANVLRNGILDGLVVTYQQLAATDELRLLVNRRKMLVIFDEVHHVGDSKSWGAAVRKVFGNAQRRLLLSGTPFRHDNERIAFMRYDRHIGQTDFGYGYGAALRDGVVAPIFFPSFESNTKWKLGAVTYEHSFEDEISRLSRAKQMNATLSAHSDYMKAVVKSAHARLLELRQHHANAGGLITCIDQSHARAVAAMVKKVIGKAPVLAISDEKDSSRRIEDFNQSDDLFLVAVRMVSEGVDIKRLRVGVYATNVGTELFFRQFVGRFTRLVDGLEDQSGFVYIPRHPGIIAHAKAIQEERAHVLLPQEALPREPVIRKVEPVGEPVEFNPISAIATAHDTIAGDMTFTAEELARARQIKVVTGLGHLTDEAVAKILRANARMEAV